MRQLSHAHDGVKVSGPTPYGAHQDGTLPIFKDTTPAEYDKLAEDGYELILGECEGDHALRKAAGYGNEALINHALKLPTTGAAINRCNPKGSTPLLATGSSTYSRREFRGPL